MADLVLVNKTDDDRVSLAKETRRDYKNAMHLLPAKENGWLVKVLNTSGLHGIGIEELEEEVHRFEALTKSNESFDLNRQKQSSYWLEESLNQQLLDTFKNKEGIKELLETLKAQVTDHKISPFHAAELLIKEFLKQ